MFKISSLIPVYQIVVLNGYKNYNGKGSSNKGAAPHSLSGILKRPQIHYWSLGSFVAAEKICLQFSLHLNLSLSLLL